MSSSSQRFVVCRVFVETFEPVALIVASFRMSNPKALPQHSP